MAVLVRRSRARTIVAMGDSLTYNGRYESTLLTALGTGWTITNKGVNGNKTSDMVTRFTADVIDLAPGYVIIWGGINDLFSSIGSTTNNLAAMYLAAKNANIKVIAVNISPCGGVSYEGENTQTWLQSINSWIAAPTDDADEIVDVYSILEDQENLTHLLAAYDGGDHLHMSNAGYDAVANAIYNEAFQ